MSSQSQLGMRWLSENRQEQHREQERGPNVVLPCMTSTLRLELTHGAKECSMTVLVNHCHRWELLAASTWT